jgi:hypothetical protein
MGTFNYLKIFPGVLFSPTTAFGILGSGDLRFNGLFKNIGLPMLIIGAYGRVMSEVRVADPNTLPPIIAHFFVHLLVLCIGVLFCSLMLSKLAPRYGLSVSFGTMAKISIVSYIPVCLALFISGLLFGNTYLVLAGLLAGLFLFGKGLRVLANFPPNRLVGFVFIAFIVFLGVMYFFLFLFRNFLFLVY